MLIGEVASARRSNSSRCWAALSSGDVSVFPIMHRILEPLAPQTKLAAVGECIYCRRRPPEISLTDEHIIADGFGGDLVLPDASCRDCSRITGRVEQDILRHNLQQPRGAFGVRSRKKRAKQTSYRVNVAEDGEPPIHKDIPFEPGMAAFLVTAVTDQTPGILRGASPDEAMPMMRASFSTQADFNERMKKTVGEGFYRHGFRFHPGIFGQMIAKTCHAFAVAHLGIDGFEPFLADYTIKPVPPPFDGYHLASLVAPMQTQYLHEIRLGTAFAPIVTAIGVGAREVYVVQWRIFGQISGPLLMAVVGKPISPAPPE